MAAQNRGTERKKAPGRPFEPGKSGNPGGRPKEVKEVMELARKHTEAAIARLFHWVQSEDPRASVAAAQALLDRGWGKAALPVEHSGSVNLSGELDAIATKVYNGE